MTASASDAANWMKEAVTNEGFLYQDVAASEIASRFGSDFTYINASGNLAIRADVLKLFKTETAESVIWERGQRIWRKRESYDLPGRQQS
jgi:hypothetical protein